MNTPQKGRVIWITGLSGAGKSTIARALCERWRALGMPCIVLDGDHVRRACGNDLGHDPSDRLKNAYRIGGFAALLAEQGLGVIVATMSLFHEIHLWNRRCLPGYFEVLLEVDLEVCRSRDPKGVYGGADGAARHDIGGVDLEVQFPMRADLRIDNNRERSDVTGIADRILSAMHLENRP